MARSRTRDIATILGRTESINTDNTAITAGGGAGGGSLTTYTSLDSLPSSGLTLGDQAFVSSARRLYVSDGNGWYSVAVANASPRWDSAPESEYTIADSATPLVITAKPVDSDNPYSHLINQSFASDSAQYMVNITIDSSVFTFTPKSADSIGIEVANGNLADSNGDFTYTFKWTDGINILSSPAIISYFPAGGWSDPVYIARVASVADELSSFPNTEFMGSTWSHNGGNADGGTINISGSGQYQLYSISMGKRTAVQGNIPSIYMRVYSGTSATGTLISNQTITYPAQTGDTSAPHAAQELIFPEPVTLDRGTTYSVAYAVSQNLGVSSGGLTVGDGQRTSYNLSANGGGTITWGDMTYGAADPFDTSNGTYFNANNAGGQLPIFGFKFPI